MHHQAIQSKTCCPNKRIKFVRCAHSTRNGEAPLLAAYARRWTEDIRRSELRTAVLRRGGMGPE